MKTGSKKQAQNVDKSSQADKPAQTKQLVQQKLAFNASASMVQWCQALSNGARHRSNDRN